MAAGAAAVLALAVVSRVGAVEADPEDAASARLERASLPALVDKICKGRGFETEAEEEVVRRGLPVLPALFREQTRIEKRGSECDLPPSELMVRILSAADETKRAPAIAFALRALASHDRAEVRAALSVAGELGGGARFDQPARTPPPPDADRLLAPAVEPIWRLVRDGQGTLRSEALATMIMIGPLYGAHLADLEALLDDPSARAPALAVIERLGPKAAALGPALRRRLRAARAAQWEVGRYAEVLQKLGPAARDALPDLWAVLRDPPGRNCGDRAWEVVQLARVVTAIDPDLRASAHEGGAPAMASVLDAAFRASLLCRSSSSSTDTLDEMFRRLPARFVATALRTRVADEDLPLRYRIRAAETLTMFGTPLRPDEEALCRALAARANSTDDWDVGLAGARARCQQEGGRASVPAPPRAPRQRLVRLGDPVPDEAAATCLGGRLCGPGDARYRRTIDICCRYAYGASPPDWCRDASR